MSLAFAILLSIANAAPLTVTGKAGVSEFYLRFAVRNFDELARLCARDRDCGGGLGDPLVRLESVLETASLRFESSREMGNRLSRLDQGGVIALNRDLLFNARNGGLEPWNYPEAVEFLAQTWAPQLKITDRDQAVFVGHLKELSLKFMEREVEPRTRQFALTVFHAPVHALVLEDASPEAQALTQEIPFISQLSCGPTSGVEEPLSKIDVVAARWASSKPVARDRVRLAAAGVIEYVCGQEKFGSNFQVQVEAARREGTWVLQENTLHLTQNGIRRLL